jgi:hypothetical protein
VAVIINILSLSFARDWSRAVNISYPRQQENPLSGTVRSDIINGLGAGAVEGGGGSVD